MRFAYSNIKNIIDFFLRENFCVSRKNYFEKNETKDNLFSDKNILNREKYLVETFNLADLKQNSTRRNYLENLYMIDLLDKYITKNDSTYILDIGCKNWFYAKAEYQFFIKSNQNMHLSGIEIDANRLYSNFYTRKEVAKFYTRGTNANYICGNLLMHNEKYDCIIWILPFVTEHPHIKWGLPKKYFQPEKMLKKAYELLNRNGQMLIINQGLEEFSAQKSLCEKLNIKYSEIGLINSPFLSYNERFGLIINK